MMTDHILANDISIEEMMWLAMQGGAFEWLAEEPDLYSLEDGNLAKWPENVSSVELPETDKLQSIQISNKIGFEKDFLKMAR